MAQATQPDLIIIDETLPDLPGHRLAQQLRREGLQQNVALLLMFPKPVQAEWVTDWIAKFDSYLTKPFNPMEMLKIVKCVLKIRDGVFLSDP